MGGHLGADGPEEQSAEAATAPGPHHDQVGGLGGLQQDAAGRPDAHEGGDLLVGEPAGEVVQVGLRLPLEAVEQVEAGRQGDAEAAGRDRRHECVHEGEAAPADAGLLRSPGDRTLSRLRAVEAHHDAVTEGLLVRHGHSMTRPDPTIHGESDPAPGDQGP